MVEIYKLRFKLSSTRMNRGYSFPHMIFHLTYGAYLSKWDFRTKELVLHTPKVWLVLCLVSHRASIYKWNFTILLSQSLVFWFRVFWAGWVLYIFNNSCGILLPWICLIFPPLSPCFVTSFVQNLYQWADFAQRDL